MKMREGDSYRPISWIRSLGTYYFMGALSNHPGTLVYIGCLWVLEGLLLGLSFVIAIANLLLTRSFTVLRLFCAPPPLSFPLCTLFSSMYIYIYAQVSRSLPLDRPHGVRVREPITLTHCNNVVPPISLMRERAKPERE